MQAANIKFGTDGWRGIIADDFTFDNAALACAAIVSYLAETGHSDKPLLIGYDRRFAAESYAAHLANCASSAGAQVVLASEAWPTPVTAFGVRHLEAAGAIMLTASHNPHYYQGLKFIPWFAGPAMPETTDRVTALIRDLAGSFSPPPLQLGWKGETVALKEAYFHHLDTLINANSLPSYRSGLLYVAMHGVGAGYLDGYLKRCECQVSTIQAGRDVYFGGRLPDPSAGNLQPLASKLEEQNLGMLIGTDGDADRFGIVDRAGHYFGANHVLPLLADFLLRFRGKHGRLIRTVSTSHLLDAIARDYKQELVETPVGFKYVGNELLQGGLLGGEESGGISMQGHVPEKDGILSSLLLIELLATTGETLGELYAELLKRYGERDFVRVDQEVPEKRKQALLLALSNWSSPKFAGRQITERSDLDGTRFTFDNGSWMLVRASGTEPLIRVYLETGAKDNLAKLQKQVLSELNNLTTGL